MKLFDKYLVKYEGRAVNEAGLFDTEAEALEYIESIKPPRNNVDRYHVSKNTPHFCTVYEVTRHYGGPEEGGWWYNAWSPICSVPCDLSNYEERASVLAQWFKDYAHGDIYSVLGGVQIEVFPEHEKEQHTTRGRPRYE